MTGLRPRFSSGTGSQRWHCARNRETVRHMRHDSSTTGDTKKT